jgi:SNF2 family DNA or RNA helicase
MGYSQLKYAGEFFEWAQIVIADEIHFLKNVKALRTKAFHYFIDKFPPERLIGLTGTPIKNRVTEWYSLLLLMKHSPWRSNGLQLVPPYHSYTGFCKYFSHQVVKRFGSREFIQYEGVRNVGDLKKILSGKYIRRKAKDVLELPPITRINVPASKVAAKDDYQLRDAWETFQSEKKHISTAKATSAQLKAQFTIKYAQDLIDQGEPVVIFSDHVQAVQDMGAGIKNAGSITGAINVDLRNKIINKFNEGKIDALVATIGTVSIGYTLTRARHVIFNDLSWVPGDMAQAEKRIHRIGQKEKCFVHRIYRSSIDEYIIKQLTGKIEEIDKVV